MVKIDQNTKVIARFVPDCNSRGLNIYNPYFEELGINAKYLMFSDEYPKILIESMRSLHFAGAITSGSFERDLRIIKLIDEQDVLSKRIGKVSFLVNKNGKIWGSHAAAYGLYESIMRTVDFSKKKMVILGAGTVVTGLLTVFDLKKKYPRKLEIYNRTLEKAEKLLKEFKFIDKVGTMDGAIKSSKGDIFINATGIGSPWNKEPFIFPEQFIDRFKYIIDVTFIPLKPQLIKSAEKLGKIVSPGHKMFLYQGKYSLELMLDIKVNEELLHKKILEAFKNS